MRTFFAATAAVCLVTPLFAAEGEEPEETQPEYYFVELQHATNQKLDDDFHGGNFAGNNLASLPKGEQVLEKVKFRIGKGLIQLGSQQLPDRPDEVEGLEVDLPVAKLHFLHACGYYADDGTLIGQYTINYGDETKATVPIEYGKDVRDWWQAPEPQKLTRGKVAWRGSNKATESQGRKIALYRTTWVNPHPDKDVVSIDFSSTGTSLAAPFCIAITAELE